VQSIFRFLARYARPKAPQYALGLAMLGATNYAIVRIPVLIGRSLNVLQAAGPEALQRSNALGLELAIWAVVLVVVRTLSRVLFFNPGREIEFKLRVDLFHHLLRLQRPFFSGRKIGELVSIATNDVQSVRLLVGFAGLQVFNCSVAIPLHLFQMLQTDVPLTLWCVVPVSIGAVYMRWTVRRFHATVRESMRQLARLSDRVLETYAGVATIRSHVAEDAAVERFEERNRGYLRQLLRIASIRAFSMPVLAFTGAVAAGLVLWVGGNRVLAGAIMVGDLATFMALLISLTAVLTSLAWVLASMSRGTVALGRVDEIFETRDGLPPATAHLEVSSPPRLELDDLTFHYPGSEEAALSGVNAVVEPGNTLGIFGHTGAGKTTLLNLLSRIHTPPQRSIFCNGRDIRDVPLEELRDVMAVVPQDPFLFSTSLRDNVRLAGERSGHDQVADGLRGEPEATVADQRDQRLERVLFLTTLSDDLDNLPEGLRTIVGERGVVLSGGQRQRAALARALYRETPLLLLDDVLSAVDQGTEARLVAGIRSFRASGRKPATTVVVSHRTSVLEQADEILVLERGRVVERGTHRELVARQGVYARADAHQRRTRG
jgi:ATP-binding cassette subfamily B protein